MKMIAAAEEQAPHGMMDGAWGTTHSRLRMRMGGREGNSEIGTKTRMGGSEDAPKLGGNSCIFPHQNANGIDVVGVAISDATLFPRDLAVVRC